jgi:hypothetical protein
MLGDEIESDLQNVEEDLGFPYFTWDGEDFRCIPSGTGQGGQLVSGGILSESDLVLVVRLTVFPNRQYPTQGLITYKGKQYRIDSDRVDVTGTFVRLACVDPDRVGADG